MISLICSVILNVFFLFYIRYLIKKIFYITDNKLELLERIETFTEHVAGLKEHHLFYGDQFLEQLYSHGKDLSSYLKEYSDIYELIEEEEYEEYDEKE
tara:strand:+ start:472 stop:765 length:294 start_codon:yes stop_codon:yes gene_type:complete